MLNWRSRALFFAAICLGCSSAVSGPPPKPPTKELGLMVPPAQQQVLRPGERFRARAEVLGMNVGRLEVQVHAPCDAAADSRWDIEAKMATAGVLALFNKTRGAASSTFEPEGVRLVHSLTNVQDGDDWRRYEIWSKPGRYRYRFERASGELKAGKKRYPKEENLYDTQTAIFALKSWRPKPKERGYFYVVLGRKLWRADVQYEGEEQLETDRGKLATVHFTGTAHRVDLASGEEYTPRAFSVWMTNDEERRPVRVAGDGSIGSVTFYLDGHSFDAPCRPPSAKAPSKDKSAESQKRAQARAKQPSKQTNQNGGAAGKEELIEAAPQSDQPVVPDLAADPVQPVDATPEVDVVPAPTPSAHGATPLPLEAAPAAR